MSKKQGKKKQISIHPTVWVAIITLVGTIAVALFNFSPFVDWINNKLGLTPTAIIYFTETSTPFAIETFVTTIQDTPSPTIETPSTITLESILPTEIKKSEIMMPQLIFSSSGGKAPLTVNFNASNSFVDVQGGEDLLCNFENVCKYTWSVRTGSTYLHEPTLGGSKFSYTFGKRGEYIVVVYVCRGEACNAAAAIITVK